MRDPLDVPCPRCNALPGEPCRRLSPLPKYGPRWEVIPVEDDMHDARLDAAHHAKRHEEGW